MYNGYWKVYGLCLICQYLTESVILFFEFFDVRGQLLEKVGHIVFLPRGRLEWPGRRFTPIVFGEFLYVFV